jgi:hypothetical protein
MRRIPLRPDPKRPRHYTNVRLPRHGRVRFRGTCYEAPALADHGSRPVRVVPVASGKTALVLDLTGALICQAIETPRETAASLP